MKKSTLNIINDLIERYPNICNTKESIKESISLLIDCFKGDNKLLTCGNGGSASDSLHIVGELVKSFKLKRRINKELEEALKELYPDEAESFISVLEGGLPAHSLVNEVSLITAFSNDKAAVFSFAQQVNTYGKKGDVLLGITTSGNSENVILASKIAKAKQMKVIALTGKQGGQIKDIADITICVPSENTDQIQELHLPVYHTICAALENEFFGGE